MDGLLLAGVATGHPFERFLGEEGFEVEVVAGVPQMKAFLRESRPRMVIAVGGGSLAVAAAREADGQVPLVVVGAEGDSADEERTCLRAGADAYVRAPATPELLAAWVEAVFRRLERCPWGQERYAFGDVEVDVFRRTVKRRNWRILMSATEFDLLVHFLRNPGRIVSRDEILREVWKYETCPTTRTVDNFICKLRHKIEGQESTAPRYLATIKGVGYRFHAEAPPAPAADEEA